jgi:hypothetical protein
MYTLDTKEARKADSAANAITEIGKYVGKFTQAVDITAKTGTKGVALNFEDFTGQKTRLSLYTRRENGETLMGYQTLMAIMTCLQLRGIEPRQGEVKRWCYETRQEVTEQGTIFPDLTDKPIGLLLETEDYEKKDGSVGIHMVIKGVFQDGTELTASEILDKKTKPEQLPRMVATLRHRPLKGGAATASKPAQAQHTDFDDAIPF